MPHMIGSYVRARHPRYTQSLWLIRELETRVIPKRPAAASVALRGLRARLLVSGAA